MTKALLRRREKKRSGIFFWEGGEKSGWRGTIPLKQRRNEAKFSNFHTSKRRSHGGKAISRQ